MFGTIGSVVSSLYGFHLSFCQGKDRSHNVQVNRNLSASYLFILFFSFFDKCHSCFFSCSCKPLSQSKFTIILAREFPHKTPKLHKTCTCVNYSQCKQATHLFTFPFSNSTIMRHPKQHCKQEQRHHETPLKKTVP